jgi:hypothetical protein
MKRILLACTSVISIISYAADDADMYIPLEQISVDTPEDESERTAVTIKTLYDGGVRHMQTVFNISRRSLTSVRDLSHYRNTLNLPNLTTLNASKNYLTSDDLGTILRTLVKLKTLNMGFNDVTSLAEIPLHRHLETLFLNNNKINALNVADCFGKLSQLQRGAFHGNKLIGESITNATGSYPTITELWFDYGAITERLGGQFIQVCPNLTSELCAGSNLVQKHHSRVEVAWDDCSDYPNCANPCFVYCISSAIGGAVCMLPAALVSLTATMPSFCWPCFNTFNYSHWQDNPQLRPHQTRRSVCHDTNTPHCCRTPFA